MSAPLAYRFPLRLYTRRGQALRDPEDAFPAGRWFSLAMLHLAGGAELAATFGALGKATAAVPASSVGLGTALAEQEAWRPATAGRLCPLLRAPR